MHNILVSIQQVGVYTRDSLGHAVPRASAYNNDMLQTKLIYFSLCILLAHFSSFSH